MWRSTDSGNHWTLMRAGQVTDMVFDPNSGHINAISNPTGNLDILYAAFAGDGVYISPNRGQVWNQMLGTTGDPLIQDGDFFPRRPVPVTAPPSTPNGAKGRIVLAKPELTGVFLPDGTYTGNPAQDLVYEGWLYAVVVAPSGHLDGLYLTKDLGQNWTKVTDNGIQHGGKGGPGVPSGNDHRRTDIVVAHGCGLGVSRFSGADRDDTRVDALCRRPAELSSGATTNP